VLISPREGYFSASAAGLSQSTGMPLVPSVENGNSFAASTSPLPSDTNAVIPNNGTSAFAGVPRTNSTIVHSQIASSDGSDVTQASIGTRPNRRPSREFLSTSGSVAARSITTSPTPQQQQQQQQYQAPLVQQLQQSGLIHKRTFSSESLSNGTPMKREGSRPYVDMTGDQVEHPQPVRLSRDSGSKTSVSSSAPMYHTPDDGMKVDLIR